MSARGIRRNKPSSLASLVDWGVCAQIISISSYDAWMSRSIIISWGYMVGIIISIYQLALFFQEKVHSLLRFLWRMSRPALDCIINIAYPNTFPISSHNVGLALALCLKSCQRLFTHQCPVHKKNKSHLVLLTSYLPYFLFPILFIHYSAVDIKDLKPDGSGFHSHFWCFCFLWEAPFFFSSLC